MRIIGGHYKGKQIVANHKLTLRPTTDFAKEGLFNILSNQYDFDDLDVLDLFSGTGSISYEFASRGCRNVHSVEINPLHATFIRNTVKSLNLSHIRVIREDAFHFINICKARYDFIFADPPYDMPKIAEIPGLVIDRRLLKPGGIMILEHSKNMDFRDHKNFTGQRKYGHVHFSFFTPPEE